MKNTRLYFDKDFKPITKIPLQMYLPGATPNFETDMEVIVKGNATGVADSPTWIGTTRKVCLTQAGHSFDDILATPSLLTDQFNSTDAQYDVFLKAEQNSTLASLEVLDSVNLNKYSELLASGDIVYKIQSVGSLGVTDHENNTFALDAHTSSNFIRLNVAIGPDRLGANSFIFFETSLEKLLGSKYNPITNKWYKFKLIYTAGIELSEKAKVYFETDESSEIKQRTATYYLVNTLYQAPQP